VEVILEILKIKKRGLKLVLISDLVSGFIPGVVAKALNLKILCYEGNIVPWAQPFSPRISIQKRLLDSFLLTLVKSTTNISDAIVVNDGLIKDGMIRRGVKKDKIFLIGGMVDTEKFKPLRIKADNSEFIVGFIGRLTEEKGALLLLELCKESLVKYPDVGFIILGDGALRECFQALPNIKYIGWVKHNELPKKLCPAKVIVTFQKSFGIGELEALACGKPIIVSRIGEIASLVREAEIGLVCEPNINSYVDAIGNLLKNEKLLRRLSRKSRMYILRNHSLDAICSQWKSIINNILQKG
jgi:glycosyltransferase involved in cell wall biosynthesis